MVVHEEAPPAVDPERLVAARDDEEQADLVVRQQVLERHEEPVALALGDQQGRGALDPDEPRGVPLGRNGRAAGGVNGREEQQGRLGLCCKRFTCLWLIERRLPAR